MAVTFFSGKKGRKRITLLVIAAVLVAALIAANVILNQFAPLLHSFFSGASANTGSAAAQAALASADEVVREIGEESIVLLKNDEVDGEAFLPRPKTEKFNLFGWASTDAGFLLVGGGSGGTSITAENKMRVTLTQAFEEANVEYNTTLIEKYNAFSNFDGDGGSTNDHSDRNMINPEASWYDADTMGQAKDYSSTAIVTLSRWGVENGGSGELINLKSGKFSNGALLELTVQETAIFDALRQYGFKVIVLLNTTNPLELNFLETYDDIIEACLYVGIPGQSGATAIPNILVGEKTVPVYETDENGQTVTDEDGSPVIEDWETVQISPSGRLSDTYAYSWQEHNPSYVNALASNNSLVYQEGIYIGYKWYETADVEGYYTRVGTTYDKVVQFPFGFGLSYTSFEQEILEHSFETENSFAMDKTYTVKVRVTNTGDYPGRDVVQLYYTPPVSDVETASVNLLAFNKTNVIQPGEYQDVELTFTAYDLACYDAYDANNNKHYGYELLQGDYCIRLMQNAHVGFETPQEIFVSCDGIKITEDPVTKETVENRFTTIQGVSTAYANMPIDGSTGVEGGVNYLSKKNGFANFPTVAAKAVTDAAKAAANYSYPGETNADTSSYLYGVDAGMYLYNNDGGIAYQEDLDGTNESAKLSPNADVFEDLRDWDSADWDTFLNQLKQEGDGKSLNGIKELIGKGGFQTVALEEIGKPRNKDSDGPAGFNSNVVNPGTSTEWTVFPAETFSGCSWSARLMYNLGRAQGAVGVATNRQGWYAPGVNLHRSVYNSRNYEYYSEDAVLSGKLAAQTVKGAKLNNLYCYVKHFVLSDNGQNANNWYVWVNEQALRENYLKAFEITVKEGGANAMMSAFNKLGAVWCGYNHALLTDVLRTEWGFHGSVITDWYDSGYMGDYEKAVKAGNDLWLNSTNASASLNFAKPEVAYAARQSAKGILYTMVDTYLAASDYQKAVESGEYQDPFDVDLSNREVEAEAHSAVVDALWAVADIVLVLGIGACVLFMFIPKQRKSEE